VDTTSSVAFSLRNGYIEPMPYLRRSLRNYQDLPMSKAGQAKKRDYERN
jgi:hypothetical protein